MDSLQETEKLEPNSRLDRPSRRIPSVDSPWDNLEDREHRLAQRKGDRSSHRAHHALYEDMLN